MLLLVHVAPIDLRARHVFARDRTNRCFDCLRPIRWWNRHVWVVDGERWVHLQCRKGELFFKALVADQIRCARVTADESSKLSPNHSAENKQHELSASAAQQEKVERLLILRRPAEEHAAKLRVDQSQQPRPPRLCMLCGTAEFSEKSVFCSKCGTSLRL